MSLTKAYIRYLSALLMFGLNGIVASHISLSSYEIVFTRTLLGALLLIGIFALRRQKPRLFANRVHMLWLMISGVAMGASWMLLYEAYRRIGVGVATLMYYCGPVIVMALAPLLFREKLTWPRATGFLAVAAGMVLVSPQASGGERDSLGLLCGILSAVMYAVMLIFNRKAESVTGLENSMWQLLTAFLTVAVFVGARQGYSLQIPAESWPPILILGLLNTGVGCWFYFSSIGSLPLQTVALCGYLEPLSAVGFSLLLLGERMTLLQTAGALLILGGTAFGELSGRRRESPPTA